MGSLISPQKKKEITFHFDIFQRGNEKDKIRFNGFLWVNGKYKMCFDNFLREMEKTNRVLVNPQGKWKKSIVF
jgi:hypothetical protein